MFVDTQKRGKCNLDTKKFPSIFLLNPVLSSFQLTSIAIEEEISIDKYDF